MYQHNILQHRSRNMYFRIWTQNAMAKRGQAEKNSPQHITQRTKD
jgi:hypothetical protein